MASEETIVFWSYAHDDDEASRGRVLRMAEHLQAELALLSAHPPKFFVDRDSLAWGDHWRRVVDVALDDAALLIAVVTPRYFASLECRHELLTFYGEGASRESTDLLLPVLFVPVAGLTPENPDPAMALVGKSQYEDWTKLRLADDSSAQYNESINRLAARLLDLADSVAQSRLIREAHRARVPEPDADDLAALLGRADSLWPEWLEVVGVDEAQVNASRAMSKTLSERRARLRAAHASQSAIMATFQTQALLYTPFSQEHLTRAQIYSGRTMELDPVIRAVVRAAAETPALEALLHELRERVDEAVRVIREGEAQTEYQTANEFVATLPYVTQTWREVVERERQSDSLIREANRIVLRWASDIDAVIGSTKMRESAPGLASHADGKAPDLL